METKKPSNYSLSEYLAIEADTALKHEYHGASKNYSRSPMILLIYLVVVISIVCPQK